MKKTFVLAHPTARDNAVKAVQSAPDGYMVQVAEPNRTLEQNAAQWPYLQAFADQKQLCINGAMQNVTPDDWKDVLTACWNGEIRMAAFDGKVIMLPQRTSHMGKKVFSDWMEYLVAMAAQSGVEPVYKSEHPVQPPVQARPGGGPDVSRFPRHGPDAAVTKGRCHDPCPHQPTQRFDAVAAGLF